MFQTARFRIRNPSRHKAAALRYAMENYHRVLKRMLESALADPHLAEKISREDRRGNLRVNAYQTRKLFYRLPPRRWAPAPLRD